MTGHYISDKVICPFYRCEAGQSVKCFGISEKTGITLTFADKAEAKKHKKYFCQDFNFKNCPIAKMLSFLAEKN